MNISTSVRYLHKLTDGYQQAQIVFTAVEAGIFALLEEPRTTESVAETLGWHPRGARMLLDGLVALKLVAKKDGAYHNTTVATQCLVPGSPGDQTHILQHRANCREGWSRLDEAVRKGGTVLDERRERSPEELRAFICGMADVARQSAKAILEEVDLSPYRRVLDLGAGPGTYAITFLQAHPEMRATLFDLAEVIPIAREQVAEAGLLDRVEFVAGDLTCDALGTGYDLVLVSNIIHSLGSDANRELIRKCYDAIDSDGMLIIKDFLLDPDRTGPPFGLTFALNMLVHTESGDTYTVDDVAEWTSAAGFAPGRFVAPNAYTRLWLAHKNQA